MLKQHRYPPPAKPVTRSNLASQGGSDPRTGIYIYQVNFQVKNGAALINKLACRWFDHLVSPVYMFLVVISYYSRFHEILYAKWKYWGPTILRVDIHK